MRNLVLLLWVALIGTPGAAFAQDTDPGGQATTEPAVHGPKVHVSESGDITGCSDSSGGTLAGAGIAAGGLIGNKFGGSGTSIGAQVGEAVGDHVGRKVRCDPRAEIEDGAQTEQPRKEKGASLRRLKGALGL